MPGIDRVLTTRSINEGTYYEGEIPEVGDVVECLLDEGSFPHLKEFEQYTIEEIDGGYVFFEGKGWWPSRFCLISRRAEENQMHYRNGREAKNGDEIIQIDGGGKITDVGVLIRAQPGNDYCNGIIANDRTKSFSGACLCDCLHVDDVAEMLTEKGLNKRPAGK